MCAKKNKTSVWNDKCNKLIFDDVENQTVRNQNVIIYETELQVRQNMWLMRNNPANFSSHSDFSKKKEQIGILYLTSKPH